jgi:hypothetical protein
VWGKEGESNSLMAYQEDPAAENLLDRLSNLEKYPEETLVPYEEFSIADKTYYFTPGGFLYRKDPGTEEVGGFFCGYLDDRSWHYRSVVLRERREAAA